MLKRRTFDLSFAMSFTALSMLSLDGMLTTLAALDSENLRFWESENGKLLAKNLGLSTNVLNDYDDKQIRSSSIPEIDS